MLIVLQWVLDLLFLDCALFFALMLLSLVTLIPALKYVTQLSFAFLCAHKWVVILLISCFPWMWLFILGEKPIKKFRDRHNDEYIFTIVALAIAGSAMCFLSWFAFPSFLNVILMRIGFCVVIFSTVLINYGIRPDRDNGNDEDDDDSDDPKPEDDGGGTRLLVESVDQYVRSLPRKVLEVI